MILYVVTDSARQYRQTQVWIKCQQVLEELGGDACLTLHYKRMNPRMVARLDPWAICHSGGSTMYDEYDVLDHPGYRQAVYDYPGAQIGFCGGHQILSVFFGSRIGPMRRLRPDEPDLAGYCPGAFKEWGVYPVQLLKKDPLFKGLGRTLRVQEYHSWEVKRLGRDLELLASTQGCKVQAFRHRHRPIYGTQCHPEQSSRHYPDGFGVLRNFFGLARQAGNARRHEGVKVGSTNRSIKG